MNKALIAIDFINDIVDAKGRIPSSEESPNDFDKNHKFKVDAHLVM
ncbi:hypothetical protein [Photobacterium damselae]|nr:hypothetical protein [Photobacterium damselae]